MYRQTLPRRERLQGKREFKEVFREGNRLQGRYVTIFFARNGTFQRKVAFIATKAVGSAVKRNRLKRLLREIYRRNKEQIVGDVHLILMGKLPFQGKCQDLEPEVLDLLKKAQLQKS